MTHNQVRLATRPLVCRPDDEVDLKLPYPTGIDQLTDYIDAAHKN
jgi:hypothetical protein